MNQVSQAIQGIINAHPASRVRGHQPQYETLPVPPLSELSILIQALKAPSVKSKEGAPLTTIIAQTLDESGSMDTGLEQTKKGYNERLAKIRQNAEAIGCRMLQVNFNTTNRVIADNVSAGQVANLSEETYQPGGGTALYDTVVAVIKKILSHPLAHNDETSILLNIDTDGDDMDSHVWKTKHMAEFRELMLAVKQNDRWTVALSGPAVKLQQFSDLMGVEPQNVAAFEPHSVASRAMAANSGVQAMGSFMSMRSLGEKKMSSLYAGTEAGAYAASILNERI